MKTAEEIIREAYGEHYDKFKDSIDENGWTEDAIYDFLVCEWHPDKWGKARPKSLAGLENNNGWTKIEDIEKVPTEKCWIYKEWSGDLFIGFFYNEYGYNAHKDATHYQPIVKPKPPIY